MHPFALRSVPEPRLDVLGSVGSPRVELLSIAAQSKATPAVASRGVAAGGIVGTPRSPKRVGLAGLASSLVLGAMLVGCSDEGAQPAASAKSDSAASASATAGGESTPAIGVPALPDDLPNALVLALSAFDARKPGDQGPPVPLPAELELIVRRGGQWIATRMTDPESNVFHKALAYTTPEGEQVLLTGGGTKALLKLWRKQAGQLVSQTIWEKDFGGKFSRMRDIEVGDVDGDGSRVIAVATHDQGVVAVVRPKEGGYSVEELDHEKNTFVHEIELGDVDGDGVLEIYATPSEPNRLDGSEQEGHVVRYVPKKGEGRKIVADLGKRHAKEILVHDVDGNGKDELYVLVEGQKAPSGEGLLHRTEIWRYEADTPPDQGVPIAEFEDRLGRFLTPADLDGDGRKEIVAALYQKGVWWLEPGEDVSKPWTKRVVDRDSKSFEHAAIATDLDGDGRQELYVANDDGKSIRRYVWNGRRLVKEEIYARQDDRSILTWNIMPIPVALVPDAAAAAPSASAQ
ncbi:MAG: VCBS repeat-containing protein [Deltaproteobacteria bacterium]|nr:VCBS repeat-containing protein [Deltaproteobacteria bacterium]